MSFRGGTAAVTLEELLLTGRRNKLLPDLDEVIHEHIRDCHGSLERMVGQICLVGAVR